MSRSYHVIGANLKPNCTKCMNIIDHGKKLCDACTPKPLKPVRDSDIVSALKERNTRKGLKSNDVGYSYYADIKGDGRNIKRVYTIINADGGVTYSHMNGGTKRDTLAKIRATA